MVVLLLLAALLPGAASSTLFGPSFLTGEVGGSVTHQCFYSTTPANRHDRKYWCKVAGGGVCSTIVSTAGYTSQAHQGRVSLQDVPQNGTFMVTMAELTENDTGIYRCGIGSTNRGLFVYLNLTVSADAGTVVTTELVQGQLHGSVTVLCPAGATQSREKRLWCRVGRASCLPIADSDGYVAKSYQGRISIAPQESSGAFKVLINDLKKEDSGLYRCGTGGVSSWHGPQLVALQVTTASSLPRGPKLLTGTVGGSLSLKCHHDPKGSYQKKYLCRWRAGSCSLLLDLDGFVAESYRGRVQAASSQQQPGTYTVVLSQLREEDAGWYWCGARSGHTEHTSPLKLLIRKESCSSQHPAAATPLRPPSASPAPSSSPPGRSTTGLRQTTGSSTTASTSPPLPTASPSASRTSPGRIYHQSSSEEPHLLPVLLPALILLALITSTFLILTKMKLQKERVLQPAEP
ncbi:polymeric immunoglobulin receptor-like [Melanerpes formicivorus]|uniref:polymeric immunoglobulin receptor-like n=1 Tax=Melanerpes formicivorus TaxID=211600 RepID=UPI00358E2129